MKSIPRVQPKSNISKRKSNISKTKSKLNNKRKPISRRRLKFTNSQNARKNNSIFTKIDKPFGNNGKLKTLFIINQKTEWLPWFERFQHYRHSNLDITYLKLSTYSAVLNRIKKLRSNIIYDLIIVIPDHGFEPNKKKYLKPSFQWKSGTDNINVTELYLELIKRSKHVHTLTCYFGNYLDSIKNSINILKHNCYISGFNSHIGYESYIDRWILNGCSPYHTPTNFNFKQKQFNYILLEKIK